METEEALRRRIATVSNLHSVVRTLKSLSAVNSRHFDKVDKSLDNYNQTIELGLQAALRGRVFEPVRRKPAPTRLAAVVFGSDAGFCGRFNQDLCHHALDKMNGFQVPMLARQVLAVGARVAASLETHGQPIEDIFSAPASPAGINALVAQILTRIDAWRRQSIEQVLLFYSQSGSHRLMHLLPVDLRQFARLAREPWPSRGLPMHTLDAERLLAAIIRQHLFVSLFRAAALSLASENQMRLRAMQAAEKNIQDRLDELQAVYHGRRQDAIDAELLDIGAGFEAVGGVANI